MRAPWRAPLASLPLSPSDPAVRTCLFSSADIVSVWCNAAAFAKGRGRLPAHLSDSPRTPDSPRSAQAVFAGAHQCTRPIGLGTARLASAPLSHRLRQSACACSIQVLRQYKGAASDRCDLLASPCALLRSARAMLIVVRQTTLHQDGHRSPGFAPSALLTLPSACTFQLMGVAPGCSGFPPFS
jgi:hypothetical protein